MFILIVLLIGVVSMACPAKVYSSGCWFLLFSRRQLSFFVCI